MVLGRFGWVWVAPYFNKCALQRQTKQFKIAPSSSNIQAKAFVVQGVVSPFFKQTRSCPQVCTVTWHDVISKMDPDGYKVNYFQNPFKSQQNCNFVNRVSTTSSQFSNDFFSEQMI